jgi:riboflavin kinase / FMN adenylyltransferase
MQIITDITKPIEQMRGAVVALGNFDGVHKGHQVVLARARDMAITASKPFGVVTFEPHPRSIFLPKDAPFRLTPAMAKRRVLADILKFHFPNVFQKYVQKILLRMCC